ncbi:MAG: ammonium transporter, partial [Gemmatimonadaceae bacterium]|nr:ammonium transporter [Acetobacteraceae bacterium]
MRTVTRLLTTLPALLAAIPAWAQTAAETVAPVVEPVVAAVEPKIDTGDTAWMLTSTALVLLMTIPGLALFYAGMVRKKNVLATLMQSFSVCALVTILWMVV